MKELIPHLVQAIAFIIFAALAIYFIYWMISERQQTKQLYYGTSYNAAGSNDLLVFHGLHSEGPLLTDKEVRLCKMLAQTKNQGPWGNAIREVMDRGGRDDVRKLISQLREAAHDNSDTLIKIIGEGAVNELLTEEIAL